MCSLVGLSNEMNRAHVKAVRMFKTVFRFCIFCLQVWEPGPQRAVRWGEPGKACNSCEQPLDLPFLTLQQPTRQRFMTAGEEEAATERKKERRRKKDGHGRRRRQRDRGRKNEINIQRSEDRGAEMRCEKESKMKEERKINRQRKRGERVIEKRRGENKMADWDKITDKTI